MWQQYSCFPRLKKNAFVVVVVLIPLEKSVVFCLRLIFLND